MMDQYAKLAAILWYLSQEDLDSLLLAGETLAVERYNSVWQSPSDLGFLGGAE